MASSATRKRAKRRHVRRDSTDFRDKIYEPSLVQIERQRLPDPSLLQLLDQGEEGACTGFGLAATIHLLLRMRDGKRADSVSPHMLYAMAKRHDQWPGEEYEGSSARGAMKGWHKFGACAEADWPTAAGHLTEAAQQSAFLHPLGAYYRVLPKRVDIHAALNEVGVIFAAAATHRGWDAVVKGEGKIPYEARYACDSGHAFAIVGYTEEGLLIQNSWGLEWGGVELGKRKYPGCALWSYADFERNVWDLWVARLALPIADIGALAPSVGRYTQSERDGSVTRKAPPRALIRDHYVHIDDGQFVAGGDYYSDPAEVDDSLARAVCSGKRHVLLFAHGGLNSLDASVARVAAFRPVFERNGIHGISFLWETGLLEELRDVVGRKHTIAAERAGGMSDWTDRLIEKLSQRAGHALWMEMIADAERAFQKGGAGRHVVERLITELSRLPPAKQPRVHLVGHSAGSIWHAYFLKTWRELQGPTLSDLILFAPACCHDLFAAEIRPALLAGTAERLHHFLLDDETELADNVGLLYRKSLLFLVSRAYQAKGAEVPLLGLERHLSKLPKQGIEKRVSHYTTKTHPDLTRSSSHGDFDNDSVSMNSMLAITLTGKPDGKVPKPFLKEEVVGY